MLAKKNTYSRNYFSFTFFVRLIIRFLIVVGLCGLTIGIFRILFDLRHLFTDDFENTLRQLIVHLIILLALIEVIKTAMSYLTEGRVKVTYIVDTVLIVMLNEVLSIWFKGIDVVGLLILLFIIGALIGIRVIAIKFSPNHEFD